MTGTYLVEISHERISPITVEAESREEAIERAMASEGELGQELDGETKVVCVRCLQKRAVL